MLAGYSNSPGYGCTPPTGLGSFQEIFDKGVNLNDAKHIKNIDALILWGGEDIGTSLYNERPKYSYGNSLPSERDVFEWELLKICTKKKIPVIGVCRGAQLMCAFAGGKLIQDTDGHGYSHNVVTTDRVFKNVTSSHHQMMFPEFTDHELLAWTEKPLSSRYVGVEVLKDFLEPEVVLFNDIGLAIQPHPEWEQTSEFTHWVHKQILTRLYGESDAT